MILNLTEMSDEEIDERCEEFLKKWRTELTQ